MSFYSKQLAAKFLASDKPPRLEADWAAASTAAQKTRDGYIASLHLDEDTAQMLALLMHDADETAALRWLEQGVRAGLADAVRYIYEERARIEESFETFVRVEPQDPDHAYKISRHLDVLLDIKDKNRAAYNSLVLYELLREILMRSAADA